MLNKQNKLIDIRHLKKYFPARHGFFSSKSDRVIKAVDDVNLSIFEGETLGLVGGKRVG